MTPIRHARVFLVIGALLAAAACSESTGPAPAPDEHLIGPLLQWTGLLRCSALPFDSTTQAIGPLGGTMHVGPHTFVVPAGALSQSVSITAVAPVGHVNQVRFQPEGLVFAVPAHLTMSYANCGLVGLLIPKRIAYTDDHLGILSYLTSVTNFGARTVTGDVPHFSGYAVAW